MKIFDCFMYYDEDLILDLRLNYLNSYIDKFVIVESNYTHSGESRKLLFDIKKFSKFKDKINYIILDKLPTDLFTINTGDSDHKQNSKIILNAMKRENLQRQTILKGLNLASPDDLIIISDIDEIPNLEENNITEIKNKIIFFKQKYFHYKFNLKLEKTYWHGSRACKKKHLISPQWLRNIKDKDYPFWRIDTFFFNLINQNTKKYKNIKFIKNGGWHFSNLKNPADIEKKMKTYAHHREFEVNPVNAEKIKEIIKERKAIYNLGVDKRKNKFDLSQKLTVTDIAELPSYIVKNIEKYKDWIV